MRPLALILGIFLPIAAQATTPSDDFLRTYAAENELTRATNAYEICDGLFKAWPSPDYQQSILQIGEAWKSNSEPAYYLVNTCHIMWMSRYLDPSKHLQVKAAHEYAEFAQRLSKFDLIHGAKYLRQQIRAYLPLSASPNPSIPPSPFEVLGQMSSSDRELDETLQYEQRQAITAVAATAGNVAITLRTLKAVAGAVETRSEMFARGVKQMAAITLLAYAAGELFDLGLWELRQRELWLPVHELNQRLSQGQTSTPLPILLNEFYRATEQLGYFYSYNLYLSETTANKAHATVNESCYPELQKFFAQAQPTNTDLAKAFGAGTICADAATLWAGASQFLSQHFPGQPMPLQVADRLLARAKRTYISYEATKDYEKTLPQCRPKFSSYGGGSLTTECFDPVRGVWGDFALNREWANFGHLTKKGNGPTLLTHSDAIKQIMAKG